MTQRAVAGFEFEEGLFMPPVDAGRLGGRFPITFGRRADNDVVLHHPSVSGRHAQLTVEDDGEGRRRYVLVDRGSTNGTHVEGARITRHTLDNGDLIHLGDVGLRFGELSPRWWDEARRDYLTSALPWPLAIPYQQVATATEPVARGVALYRLCEEMTRLVTAAGAAVAAANGGADAALRWALTRLRQPTPVDWVGAVSAVVRAGTDRGWLAHLPGLAESASGEIRGTEGAWDALTQWVRTAASSGADESPQTIEAALGILEPGVIELLLSWTFLHEGRLIWVEREPDDPMTFSVQVAHGARPVTTLRRVQLHGQLPAVGQPYWILSAAGGAACLTPWYRTTGDAGAPVISWEGCPDDLSPRYRSAASGNVVEVAADGIGTIPMGPAGSHRWAGFRDYLGVDRSVGAIVDLRTPPDVWARILGVASEGRATDTFAELKALRDEE